MHNLQELATAFRCNAMPVNPNPFLHGLLRGIEQNGMSWIQSDQAKAMLWILNAQAFGQLSDINMFEEWQRLNKALTNDKATV